MINTAKFFLLCAPIIKRVFDNTINIDSKKNKKITETHKQPFFLHNFLYKILISYFLKKK